MTETTSRSPSRPSSESDALERLPQGDTCRPVCASWCSRSRSARTPLRSQDWTDLRLPEATLNRFKEGEEHCGGRWSRAAASSCS